jgi:hypothetical protein
VLDASSQAAARTVNHHCDPGWVDPKLVDVVEQPELPAKQSSTFCHNSLPS